MILELGFAIFGVMAGLAMLGLVTLFVLAYVDARKRRERR